MSKLSLSVQYANDEDEPPLRRRVGALLRAAWRQCEEDGEVTVRFVDEAESARLNRRYRQRNAPTNVLSFCYETSPILGDIVVCNAVVRREAKQYGVLLADRYAHMIVHGALHLQGHTHDTKETAAQMELSESDILSQFNIHHPYTVFT